MTGTPIQPKIVAQDESLAHVMCGHCPKTVHPQAAARSTVFRRRIFEFAPDTFAAIEYVGSSVMVVGPEGAVIVGVHDHMQNGQLVSNHFAKLRGDIPICAIIYNDSLADNYGGVQAFISEQDAAEGRVKVIAHELFERMLKNFGDVGNIMTWRSAYQAGAFLEKGPEGNVHTGAIAYTPGKVSYIAPNMLVAAEWKGKLGGVATEIYHFPAESDDGLVTWFPDQKTLVVGHVLFGDLLPQVYAQRGIVRDPKRWYKGIEDLIAFVEERDVHYMVPMHFFEPIAGRERIMEVLTINRDTLQYIADQSARFINNGYRPDDLAVTLALPPHLADHPDLQEHYGRLQQHVRQQYHEHLGWFQGDPVFLDPLPLMDRSRLYVEALGGRDALVARARGAANAGHLAWAAELLSWAIANDPDDGEACGMKADILRQMGFAAPNATYRNWFLTSALEMEGRLPAIRLDKAIMLPEQILRDQTPIEMVETLKARLKAEQVFDLTCTMMLLFDDGFDPVTLILRRGVLETRAGASPSQDVRLRMTRPVLLDLIEDRLSVAAAIETGQVVVDHGDRALIDRLGGCFEPSAGGNFPLAMPTRLKARSKERPRTGARS